MNIGYGEHKTLHWLKNAWLQYIHYANLLLSWIGHFYIEFLSLSLKTANYSFNPMWMWKGFKILLLWNLFLIGLSSQESWTTNADWQIIHKTLSW